jgi:molybdenum cofactor synthesis domain-containing protein
MSSCIFIGIGDEILSGKTRDANLQYLAKSCQVYGISLQQARIIADDEQAIIDTIIAVKDDYDYVITSGGIGPTHDDITTATVAKALNKDIELNQEAKSLLIEHYGNENLNEMRLKMAYLPKDCQLIYNPMTKAPGFILDNIHVMAGVPKIFQLMLDSVISNWRRGAIVHAKSLLLNQREGEIAEKLQDIQQKFINIVAIGSYPKFYDNGDLKVEIVLRSSNEKVLAQCFQICQQEFVN